MLLSRRSFLQLGIATIAATNPVTRLLSELPQYKYKAAASIVSFGGIYEHIYINDKITHYRYLGNFSVICPKETSNVLRIWADNILIHDVRKNLITPISMVNQEKDIIVFSNFDLTMYANRIPNIQVEILA